MKARDLAFAAYGTEGQPAEAGRSANVLVLQTWQGDLIGPGVVDGIDEEAGVVAFELWRPGQVFAKPEDLPEGLRRLLKPIPSRWVLDVPLSRIECVYVGLDFISQVPLHGISLPEGLLAPP